MFIGITRQARRDVLRMALHDFIDNYANKVVNLSIVTEADQQLGVLLQEARLILREITASEHLVNADPTHIGEQ